MRPTLLAFIAVPAALLLLGSPGNAQHAGHGAGAPPTMPRMGGAPVRKPDTIIFAPQQSDGPISLEVAPVWYPGRLELGFKVNTHAGDLAALDLAALTRLVVGPDTLKPNAADPLSGHHAAARVSFPLAAAPRGFTVLVAVDSGSAPRELQWTEQRSVPASRP